MKRVCKLIVVTARSALLLSFLSLIAPGAGAAVASPVKTYSKTASFDDIRFELNNAIIERGLKLDRNGNIAEMLKRTSVAIGGGKVIYKHAEYFTFCSAKLSRAMMAADPLNGTHCPFGIFLYESIAKPGVVVVSYQTHPTTGNAASIKAFAAIDKMLDGMARQVME